MKPKISFERTSFRLMYYRYRSSSLYTVTFLVIIGFVSLFLFTKFIVPQINEWFEIQREVAATEKKIANLNQNLRYLSSLDQTSVDDKFQVALHAVPEQSDFAGIITAINAASIKANVSPDQFSFVPGKVDSQKASGLQTVRLTVSLKGTVRDVKAFLQELANEVPLTRIASVSVDHGEASVTFLFYFKTLPNIAVDRTTLLQETADSNANLLKQLTAWDNDTKNYESISFNASSSAFTSPF